MSFICIHCVVRTIFYVIILYVKATINVPLVRSRTGKVSNAANCLPFDLGNEVRAHKMPQSEVVRLPLILHITKGDEILSKAIAKHRDAISNALSALSGDSD